jgi:hypothetical protein
MQTPGAESLAMRFGRNQSLTFNIYGAGVTISTLGM